MQVIQVSGGCVPCYRCDVCWVLLFPFVVQQRSGFIRGLGSLQKFRKTREGFSRAGKVLKK